MVPLATLEVKITALEPSVIVTLPVKLNCPTPAAVKVPVFSDTVPVVDVVVPLSTNWVSGTFRT
jgi:hypothetical protein